MAKILMIQGSLSKDSRTAILVRETGQELERRQLENETLDLRDLDLQFCDGRSLQEYNEDMQNAFKKLEQAEAFIFGMPVYCFSVSGPLKNFIDITSGAMENKVAGILCNAGGNHSYMASAELSKILAYESHVTVVQPTVYSSYEDYNEEGLMGEKVKSKIKDMVSTLERYWNK